MTIAAFSFFSSLVALALAYELKFAQATLHFGRTWSGETAGTGFQDAITPPASTTVGLLTYATTLIALVLGFAFFGMAKGALLLILFVLVVSVTAAVLPPPPSPHFRRLITDSMIRRYADYLRDGDHMRADAMAELLKRAGLPVPSFHDLAK